MRSKHFSEKGIALIAVTAALAIISALVTDFSYSTVIDSASAANARDEMRAHFLARSGMNLSRLVVKVQKEVVDKYRQYLGDIQLADFLPMIMGAFSGSQEEVAGLASLVGAEPGAEGMKGLGLDAGEFDLNVTTEDGKINVNCANGSTATQKQLEQMLAALVAPTTYDPLFENQDAEGQYTDRAMFVRAIMDWVDRDEAGYGAGGAPEDYGYESLKDPYRAKNNYLDSVDELQLVRGMDDRKWAVFGQAFTIYGGCKINIGAANDLNVIASVIYQSAKDAKDPVLSDPVKLYTLAARVAQAKGMGIAFEDLKSFADYVKNPESSIADAIAKLTGGGGAAPAGEAAPPVQGVELDPAKLALVARAGGRRTYRVEATAKMGRVEKKITAVWDGDTQNQNARDPAYSRGAWVYWREE